MWYIQLETKIFEISFSSSILARFDLMINSLNSSNITAYFGDFCNSKELRHIKLQLTIRKNTCIEVRTCTSLLILHMKLSLFKVWGIGAMTQLTWQVCSVPEYPMCKKSPKTSSCSWSIPISQKNSNRVCTLSLTLKYPTWPQLFTKGIHWRWAQVFSTMQISCQY